MEAGGNGFVRRTSSALLWFALDLGIVVGAYVAALYLRFEGEVPAESWRQVAWAGPLIGLAYILAYQMLGVYRTAWQYGSVRDALTLAIAVGVVTGGVLSVNALLPSRPIPLSVNVISAAFIFLFHAMLRVLPRLWSTSWVMPAEFVGPRKRVLIVGAGDTGQVLARELQVNRNQPHRAVAFIDDDPKLRGKRIHGVQVAGNRADIPQVIERERIEVVALALPPEEAPRLQEVLALIEPSGVQVRIVPVLSEVMAGRARRGELREVTMEDLLAREPVRVNEDQCLAAVKGKVVLVTGAAGSIGAELTKRLLEFQPGALHLLDTNETGLHELRLDLQQKASTGLTIKNWLRSITAAGSMREVFQAVHPQVVFHLAAYKLVPMMEDHPDQAFETNVLGTLNVFEAAIEVGVEQVVFLSSHTAVNPASVYGASKRIGELLVISSSGRTRFCTVRLTNVIDARGAVLGRFTLQIQQGLPISVTHPEMARYFLTINEVASLTIQAASLSRGGEIFMVDVGEEVKIADLAERLHRMLEPGEDPNIVYTGPRPGDRLRENLIGDFEAFEATDHPKVFKVRSSRQFSGAELIAGIRELEMDLPRRRVNLPAKLHALARIDRDEPPRPGLPEGGAEAPRAEARADEPAG